MNPKTFLTRRRLLGAGALLALGVAGGAITSRRLSVERRTLTLPRWDAEGFRIVQLSDVHLDHEKAVHRAQEAVRLALAEKPDAIVVTGDFVTHATSKSADRIVAAFRELHEANCPCLAVLGNHDYWGGHAPELIAALARTPLRLLRNEIFEVQGVSIAGMDDGLAGRCRPEILKAGKASRSLVALLHEPDFVERMPGAVSLQLSGHSHGGEICLPGGVALHTPYGALRYTGGFYPDAPLPLYVSRGVATIGPMRINCPPEVSVLTLVRA